MKKYLYTSLLLLAVWSMVPSCSNDENKVYTITVDRESLMDIPAQNPGVEPIIVTTDAPYWVCVAPDWVKPDMINGPTGTTVLSLSFLSNYKNEGVETQPRSGEVMLAGSGATCIIPVRQHGFTPEFDPNSSIGGITTLEEFEKFIEAVNDGTSLSRWQNDDGNVELLTDLDLSMFSSWTPIGFCTIQSWGATSVTTKGNAFTGTFDGGNHTISNLKMEFSPSEGSGTWGFFGTIGAGALVKNLVFDSSCSMNISTGVSGVFGTLAGLVADGSVENVKSYATVTGGGMPSLTNNAATGRMVVGGLVGWLHAMDGEPSLKDLHNAGSIGSEASPFSRGGNNGNGANGTMLGGIVGFSSNNNNDHVQTMTGLVNDAVIYSNTGRVSGIVASANRYTQVVNAVNNGNVYYSGSGGFRPGNITCFLGIGGLLDGCINRGDLIAPDCESAAGVACYINGASIKITGCSSIGATIVGKNVVMDGPQTYNGVLFGRANVADTEFSGCSVSGKIGTSLDNLVTLTAANYMLYVGENYKGANPNITEANITFASE